MAEIFPNHDCGTKFLAVSTEKGGLGEWSGGEARESVGGGGGDMEDEQEEVEGEEGGGGGGGGSKFVSRCFGFNVVSTAQGHLSTTKPCHT